MATRSSWKGCLQLSLVCVPVKAYSTASSGGGEVHLNQLHADCHRRIQYKKTCPLHGEVSNDQIVSGYEYAQDQYVVVDPEELDRLRTEADKAIKIDVFIDSGAFDPLYGTGKRYYLAPDGPAGQKAYALLYHAMVEEKRYALAQVVLHGREQLVLLRPQESFGARAFCHNLGNMRNLGGDQLGGVPTDSVESIDVFVGVSLNGFGCYNYFLIFFFAPLAAH
jgi:DNA end-binding protein Ku